MDFSGDVENICDTAFADIPRMEGHANDCALQVLPSFVVFVLWSMPFQSVSVGVLYRRGVSAHLGTNTCLVWKKSSDKPTIILLIR